MTRNAADIFCEARELAPEAREAFLRGACGADAALRARVETLLRADAEAGAFLSAPSAPAQEQAGAQIGRYKLLEQIGEGGMGTIWMAEQREPVKRRVALKIIKLGMDTKQVIARFEAERQALAMMDHPNIAKVLDAGATETGRPYFVMEYIRGVPILEYCDGEKVDTQGRLELFTSVCHAIQHAHQKGIIHRDIKPSNVLVTLHDGVPVPKVIDFGIAKATNSELTARTLFTEHRQMIGTPAYMSPEQAEMSGLDIDTRSDIYSLGVLLYELLTGTTPFDTKALLDQGYAELMRTIREVEPHKPSTRISSLGDTGTRTALQRKVDAKKLSLLLRGDIDWIVMKCLEKDRSRRYETANGLAADIRRHLSDEPVSAGAPSAVYKLRKFARRNRGKVIAASSVLAALLLAVVGASWGMVEKNRARSAQLLRQIEDEQRTAAEDARLLRNAEAVEGLLAQCEEALRSGDAAKAKVAIDAARKRAAEGGAENSAPRLARLTADLDLVVELDAIDQFRWTWTDNHFATAATFAARMRGPLEKFGADPDHVSVESAAAAVNASTVRERIVAALDWQLWSRHSEAVRALLRHLDTDPFRNEIRDSNLAKDIPRFVELTHRPEVLEQPAEFAAFLGDFNPIDAHRRVEILQAAVLRRPKDMSVLMALHRSSQDDLRERVRWCQAAVAAAPTNIAAISNLGVALKMSGRLDEAMTCFRRAIELDPQAAPAYGNLANSLDLSGRTEEALAAHRKSIEIDPQDFENYCCFGNTLIRHGRFDEGVAALRKAIELNPQHADAYYNLGWALQSQGKRAEAIESFKKGVELDPKRSDGFGNIAVALRNLGRLDESIAYFEKCLEITPKNAPMLTNLGGVLGQLGRIDEGIALCRKAIEADPQYAMAYFNLAKCLQGAPDEVVVNIRKAIALDPEYAEAHCELGAALLEQGRFEEALAEFKLGHALGSKRPNWEYPSAAWIREAQAKLANEAKLQPRLAALLAGEYVPADNAERLEYAYLCQNKKLNHAAAGLFTAVLAADPALADNLEACVRYNAACVAALAAAGKGEDAAGLGEAELARLRGQALEWLRAEFTQVQKRFESKNPGAREIVPIALRNFLHQPDLAGIRDPAALALLPAGEQAAFGRLWAGMKALLDAVEALRQSKVAADRDEAKLKETTDALEKSRSTLGEEHADTLKLMANLGELLLSRGKFTEADPLIRKALEGQRRVLGEEHADTLRCINNMAALLREQGKLAESEELYREGLEKHRRVLGEAHAFTLAITGDFCGVLMAAGKFGEAQEVLGQGLDACRRAHPDPHPTTAMLLHHHAEAVRAQGRLDDALPEARQAFEMYRDHPEWAANEAAHALAILLTILRAQGQPDAALDARREWFAVQRRILPPGSVALGGQLAALGLELVQRGTPETAREAEPLLRECLEIRLQAIPDSWLVPNVKSLLGGALLGQKKLTDAEPLLLAGYRELKEREASIPPQGATRVPEALERVVQLYEAKGDAAEAAAWRGKGKR